MKLKSLLSKKPEKSDEVSVGYRPKPTLNKSTFLLVFAVLLAAASFYEGTAFQRNTDTNGGDSTLAVSTNGTNQDTTGGGVSNTQTGSFVRDHVIGQVTAVSSTTITVENQTSGQNTTLNITNSTQIQADGQSIPVSDIQDGDLVIVMKTSSSSSSASRIIIASGSDNWSESDTQGGGSGTGQSDTTTPQNLESN